MLSPCRIAFFGSLLVIVSPLGCSDDEPPSPASNICGDGGVAGSEACDGNNLGGKTCVGAGYADGGTLACTSGCQLDTRGCLGSGPVCGDGEATGLENCDGLDLQGKTCEEIGFDSGTLGCNASCQYDTSDCQGCGDGERQGTEVCDGADLEGATCGDLALGSGSLGCLADCTGYDPSECSGTIQPGDDCIATPCSGFTYCDFNSAECRPGCAEDSQCIAAGPGRVCNTQTRLCECAAGSHLCGGQCVRNDDVATCGTSCSPCPTVPNADVSCDGTSCISSCSAGYHDCSGACVADDDVATCGSSCSPCPTAAHGVASCDGSSCDLSCNDGYHLCDAACLSDGSVDSCGSACSPCASTANGSATCDGGSCGIACDAGYHLCGDSCLADDSVASCGSSCTACPSDPNGVSACDGVDCSLACDAGFHLCGGQCVADTSVFGCGSSCTPCATDPYGTATCDGSSCGITCDADALMCDGGCRPCPVGYVASVTCLGTECVADSCDPGAVLLGGDCLVPNIEVVDSDGTVGRRVAMATDGQGTPHIVYEDSTNLHIKYARPSGSGWTIQRVDASTESSQWPAIALTSSGEPRVIYLVAGWMHYAYPVSQTWWSYLGPDAVSEPSLAMDSSGRPHIAYRNGSGQVAHTYWFGTTLYTDSYDPRDWSFASINSNSPFGFSFEMDGSDDPHISYVADRGATSSLGYVRAQTSGGSTLTSEYVDDSIGAVSDGYTCNSSLVLDNTGVVHVAYCDVGTLTYAHQSGASWAFEAVDSTVRANYVSLALDSLGGVHISYFDKSHSDLRYAHRRDGTWDVYTLDSTGMVGRYSAIGVDSFGIPHIAYEDVTNGDLKYVSLIAP